MTAKSLHMFKNWLEKWQENPLCVTKLRPLVQKCLRGKSLEAGRAVQHGMHLLQVCVCHSLAVGAAGIWAGDSVHPQADPAQPPCDHSPLVTQVKKCILKFLKDLKACYWLSQTVTDFAKPVFHSHVHTISPPWTCSESNRQINTQQPACLLCCKKRLFWPITPRCWPTLRRATPNYVFPLTKKEKCLSWKMMEFVSDLCLWKSD